MKRDRAAEISHVRATKHFDYPSHCVSTVPSNDKNYGGLMRTSFAAAVLGGMFLAPVVAWSDCTVPPTTIVHSQGTPNPKQTILLDTTKYPTALCNDGTPGAYAIRRGFGAAANRWVIWLHGSGACVDQTTCAPRYHTPQS